MFSKLGSGICLKNTAEELRPNGFFLLPVTLGLIDKDG